MAIEDDIQKAIDQNLTNEVASRLRERLEQADIDRKERTLLTKKVEKLESECVELSKLSLDAQNNIVQRQEQDARHRDLVIKEAVLEAKEKALDQRNSDIFHLASIAFDNPKWKFKSNITIPGSQDPFGTSSVIEGGETTERD